ncbi:hypothetical protein CEXT_493091 [Caerostris extrusa]|uniref:Uncharacterized protein n=1 Tax=Caerostris extrusa TaxID=172846 RepID=A0AAV4RZT8_CAEEX|nr:hypothetical protein CEXT_493091 [Caerostris extrusa]
MSADQTVEESHLSPFLLEPIGKSYQWIPQLSHLAAIFLTAVIIDILGRLIIPSPIRKPPEETVNESHFEFLL